jgi:molybdate/tungstate transport system ATP-binding protein
MIEFDRVSLTLGSFALHDVSLTINRGDYYFIVGPSGAGKTVLLEAIAGLHRPRQGRVLLRGEDITALPPEKRGIALVYQDYSLFPHMSVADNVGYGLRMQGFRKPEARREAGSLLDAFEIDQLADRYPGTLSGGEQQRVALARAVAVKPDILLLDEPLSALDPVTQEKFIRDLRRLHREHDLTIVQVSHSRREANLLATRMAVIIDGHLMDEGRADTVLKEPRNREVARFVGIENILEGVVTANDTGHATVDVGGHTFEVVTEVRKGTPVTLCVRADDVNVFVSDRFRSSARNVLQGTVTQVVENGPLAEVKVDCGVELTAVLTRRSVEDLLLAPGRPVTLTIKASAVHVIRSAPSSLESGR